MKILVVGPGAVGCLFAARFRKAGYEATLLDYRPERADRISREGIRIEGVLGEYRVEVPVVTPGTPSRPDLALICVKSNQTRQAAEEIADWLPDDGRVLTLQNGLGNFEVLQEVFGAERVLGGITAEGATVLGPGRIRHAGRGDTVIGPDPGGDETIERIVEAFRQAGFAVRTAERVDQLIWGKLIVNVGINALTALLRVKNGRLPELPTVARLMDDLVREAVAVASARGIDLPYPDPLGRVMEVCRATADNVASMLQDVLRQRPTEVAHINGAIVREGERCGVPTPVNRALTWLVQGLENSYAERVPDPPASTGE
ncbi:ketopantoate reductase family protein [Desulfatiglans anilini]|uniref:ketopantoate reductase family protein n=1 Tax=Desulfatiglans anilini TaxID=90728 RepID=UPI0003F66254|nr:2-dehydropantoate 2-reductase [Desulfatiglans anilini]